MDRITQNGIIAKYLRHVHGETNYRPDEEVLADLGGDISNDIIAAFDNGTYLYRSMSPDKTVFTVIDTEDLSKSCSGESELDEEFLVYILTGGKWIVDEPHSFIEDAVTRQEEITAGTEQEIKTKIVIRENIIKV